MFTSSKNPKPRDTQHKANEKSKAYANKFKNYRKISSPMITYGSTASSSLTGSGGGMLIELFTIDFLRSEEKKNESVVGATNFADVSVKSLKIYQPFKYKLTKILTRPSASTNAIRTTE